MTTFYQALVTLTMSFFVFTGAAGAQDAMAELKGRDGSDVGTVMLKQTETGVLLTATVKNLQPGKHAFHIHETGKCAPDMKAAGGHFAPDGNAHGFFSETGPHAGDMPNFIMPKGDKELTFEVLNTRVTLKAGAKNSLLDGDGSAIVIHQGGDDYASQPAGAAGKRVACGVISQN